MLILPIRISPDIIKDSQSGSSIGIKEKLYDNFVKDNRYMYIVKGLGVIQ